MLANKPYETTNNTYVLAISFFFVYLFIICHSP